MKNFLNLFFAIFFLGCSTLSFQDKESASIQCQSPYAMIKYPKINLEQNDLNIKEEEIQGILEKLLEDGCLELSNNDAAYDFEIIASSQSQTQSKESITTLAQENTASIHITFLLKKERTTRQFSSQQSIKIQGKKILGIGQNTLIEAKEKQDLLRRALQKTYIQAINSLR